MKKIILTVAVAVGLVLTGATPASASTTYPRVNWKTQGWGPVQCWVVRTEATYPVNVLIVKRRCLSRSHPFEGTFRNTIAVERPLSVWL